jgi:hypothetical protein
MGIQLMDSDTADTEYQQRMERQALLDERITTIVTMAEAPVSLESLYTMLPLLFPTSGYKEHEICGAGWRLCDQDILAHTSKRDLVPA